MLMRSPTRIEFKAEDAQEYLKSRERQKRQGVSGLAAPSTPAASGAARTTPVAQAVPLSGPLLPGQQVPSQAAPRGPVAHNSDGRGPPGSGDGPSGTWAPPAGGAAPPVVTAAAVRGSPSAAAGARAAGAGAGVGGSPTLAPPTRQERPAGGAGGSPVGQQHQPQVEQLTAMGFAAEQARQALSVTGGDVEAAADWLLS
mmetsp:Transcript_34810/g.78464  ORF Transcript_34810/g.78464 Transcript_34810/m.78464 type:complete len:199 (-) Transcript_34810:121-717(-)